MVSNPNDLPERPSRDRGGSAMPPPKPTVNPLLLMAAAIVISVLGTIYYLNGNVLNNFIDKKELDVKVAAMTETVNGLKSTVTTQMGQLQTSLTNGISGIPNTITTQVNTVMAGMTTQINNMQSSVSSMQSSVNDLKSQVQNYGTKIDNAVSGVTSANAKIDALTKSNSDLNTQVSTLKADLATVQAKVNALENADGNGDGDSTSPLTVTLKTIANSLSLSQITSTSGVTTTTTNTLSGSIRMAVANTSSKDITDALLDVMFAFSPPINNLTYTNSSVSLTGGSVPFTVSLVDPNEVEFYNAAWGLKVPANQTLNLFMTLTISYTVSRDNNTATYNPYNWASTYYYQVSATATK